MLGADVCKSAEFWKGTCKPSNDSNFGFACQCDDGWKQARLEHDDGLKFLPCVIPNCEFFLEKRLQKLIALCNSVVDFHVYREILCTP